MDIEKFINDLVAKNYSALCTNHVPATLQVQHYYKGGMPNGDTLVDLFSVFLIEINLYLDQTNSWTPSVIASTHKVIWDMNSKVYNLGYKELLPYLSSIDILDLLAIQNSKEVVEAMSLVEKEMSVKSIDNAYKIIEDTMHNKKELKNNPVVRAFKSKSINFKQLRQIVGPIGYRTDINGYIYRVPIATSFTKGMDNMYSFAIESRSSAKALHFSKQAISKSESFARQLQLLTMSVTKLIHVDCGSTATKEFFVRSEGHPTLSPNSSGDIHNLIGSPYKLSPNDAVWKQVSLSDRSIENKTIYLRPVDKCKLKNPHHICSGCFGGLSKNIPIHANIGHYSTNVLMKQMSQSILSIKHLISSAIAADAVLPDEAPSFFKVKKASFYIDQEEIKKYDKVIIKILKDEGFSIKDVRTKDMVKKIAWERATNIKTILYEYVKDGDIIKGSFKIGTAHRTGRLVTKVFEFLLGNKSYVIDNRGNYHIDLKRWKFKTPFITLPEIEFSYFTLYLEVASLIKSRQILKGGRSKDNADTLAFKIFDLVNTKLNVNMKYIETIVYAFTCKDLSKGDIRLGRNVEDAQLASLSHAILSRGQGAATAFGITKHRSIAPEMFLTTSIVDGPLDVLIRPKEVLENMDPHSRGDYNGF